MTVHGGDKFKFRWAKGHIFEEPTFDIEINFTEDFIEHTSKKIMTHDPNKFQNLGILYSNKKTISHKEKMTLTSTRYNDITITTFDKKTGFDLSLKNLGTGETVGTWKSEEDKTFEQLEDGDYTIVVDNAPEGYDVSKDLENSKFRVDENTELKRIEINLENLYVGQGKGDTTGDESDKSGETKGDESDKTSKEDKGSSEKGAGVGFATAVEPTPLAFIGVLLSIVGLSAVSIIDKTKKEV